MSYPWASKENKGRQTVSCVAQVTIQNRHLFARPRLTLQPVPTSAQRADGYLLGEKVLGYAKVLPISSSLRLSGFA